MSRTSSLLMFTVAGSVYFTSDCANKMNVHQKDQYLYEKILANKKEIDANQAEITKLKSYIADLEQVIEDTQVELENLCRDENCSENCLQLLDYIPGEDSSENQDNCEDVYRLDQIEIQQNIQDIEYDMGLDMGEDVDSDQGLE